MYEFGQNQQVVCNFIMKVIFIWVSNSEFEYKFYDAKRQIKFFYNISTNWIFTFSRKFRERENQDLKGERVQGIREI